MPRTVLIVDDERDVNDILASLVRARDFEAIQRYEGATVMEDVRKYQPDLVLLDLHLAHGSTGFPVAVRLNEMGVPCLFVSGKAPRFPMPDLAIGCLMKPFTAEDVHRSLAAAEDLLRGREAHRPKMPENLTLYEPAESPAAPEPGFIPSKRSLRTRLEHWISGHQH